MLKATERQIAALAKVFAPRYSEWTTWAEDNLTIRDASQMLDKVAGMTQNDLSPHAKRYEETKQAFEEVRQMATELGYKKN